MPRRSRDRASTGTPDASTLMFTASLAGYGRRALTLDNEGECILTLAVPASDAPALVHAYERLLDCAFRVSIAFED